MKMAEKKYGLIKAQKPTTRLLAFVSDSESDEESATKTISMGESATQKRQARLLQLAAQQEDPTIFQYDEVYDEMSAKREIEKNSRSNVNRESKYISKLLITAEKRKIEHEGRIERKMQREREAEGDQFKNKEVFVTSAYRQKLEQLKTVEDEARREEYLESVGDVRKQKDLSGFYRHIYEQKICANEEIKNKERASKRRVYRKRSENLDEEKTSETPGKKNIHLQSNLDADSDFDIDSSSDSEEQNVQTVINFDNNTKEVLKDILLKEDKSNTKKVKKDGEQINKAQIIALENKPSFAIWQKRTVGDDYTAAVNRYYERKKQIAGTGNCNYF
ncbi:nuclear speckle splicing regulatory protein 1 [Contarinia nasturtii]|uniref:nuclear speckle splicing regulatory protein 1 n=1 Tax=Contarinia nasturtii TaxID=265458 RepID=UPI0012D38DFC|nr:nuclear speckle splicing regulatory protein 1 [Contarinia nasturtii]